MNHMASLLEVFVGEFAMSSVIVRTRDEKGEKKSIATWLKSLERRTVIPSAIPQRSTDMWRASIGLFTMGWELK